MNLWAAGSTWHLYARTPPSATAHPSSLHAFGDQGTSPPTRNPGCGWGSIPAIKPVWLCPPCCRKFALGLRVGGDDSATRCVHACEEHHEAEFPDSPTVSCFYLTTSRARAVVVLVFLSLAIPCLATARCDRDPLLQTYASVVNVRFTVHGRPQLLLPGCDQVVTSDIRSAHPSAPCPISACGHYRVVYTVQLQTK